MKGITLSSFARVVPVLKVFAKNLIIAGILMFGLSLYSLTVY